MNTKTKPKRVAFFESRFNSFYGAQRSMLTLVTNLNREYFTPLVVATGEGDFNKGFEEAGIRVHVLQLHPIANVFGNQIPEYPLWKKVYVAFEILKYNFRVAQWLRKKKLILFIAMICGLYYM